MLIDLLLYWAHVLGVHCNVIIITEKHTLRLSVELDLAGRKLPPYNNHFYILGINSTSGESFIFHFSVIHQVNQTQYKRSLKIINLKILNRIYN